MSTRAEKMASQLRAIDDYRDDMWNDPALGPMLRIYVMLSHFPTEAFTDPATPKKIADCRAYTYARMARLHAKRDGCDCMEIDGMDDLMSELDAIADVDTVEALKAGESDANRQFAKLKKSGNLGKMEH